MPYLAKLYIGTNFTINSHKDRTFNEANNGEIWQAFCLHWDQQAQTAISMSIIFFSMFSMLRPGFIWLQDSGNQMFTSKTIFYNKSKAEHLSKVNCVHITALPVYRKLTYNYFLCHKHLHTLYSYSTVFLSCLLRAVTATWVIKWLWSILLNVISSDSYRPFNLA